MIRSVIIRNKESGKQIELSNSGNYILDSIDWDVPSVTTQSFRTPFQIGKILSGIVVGTRRPTISGYIVADTTKMKTLGIGWSEYNKKQEQEIMEKKKELNKLISVFQDVVIEVNGYYLDARPTDFVKYSKNETDNNEVLCYFTLEFECFNPMFYKQSKTAVLAATNDMFHFPLIMTEDTTDEYVVFGEIIKRQSILITNDGDVDVGCMITIKADGGIVKNPRVYNVGTGEYIEFENVTLEDGDYIKIITEVGEENAILHDLSEKTETSLIGDIVTESTFFKIKKGGAYYAYEVLDEYKNNIDVTVEYTERYANIEGM